MSYLAQCKAVPALEMPIPIEVLRLVNHLKLVLHFSVLINIKLCIFNLTENMSRCDIWCTYIKM